MTREELLEKGVLPQWIDEITFSFYDFSQNIQGYDLYDWLYENAFQEAESDHPDFMYSVDYEIKETDGRFITLLVWVEGSDVWRK